MAADRINEHLSNNDIRSKSESPSDSMRSRLDLLEERERFLEEHHIDTGRRTAEADIVYEKDKGFRVVSL